MHLSFNITTAAATKTLTKQKQKLFVLQNEKKHVSRCTLSSAAVHVCILFYYITSMLSLITARDTPRRCKNEEWYAQTHTHTARFKIVYAILLSATMCDPDPISSSLIHLHAALRVREEINVGGRCVTGIGNCFAQYYDKVHGYSFV